MSTHNKDSSGESANTSGEFEVHQGDHVAYHAVASTVAHGVITSVDEDHGKVTIENDNTHKKSVYKEERVIEVEEKATE